MTWLVYATASGPEVIPEDDARAHTFGTGCWCEPRFDEHVLVHNSADHREDFESGARRLS